MKRFLAFLLMIIVAVAAFTPCCTADDCQEEMMATTQQEHPEGEDSNSCSPFFTCGTCPGFTATVEPVDLPAPPEDHPQFFEAVFGYPSFTYAATPWQPPRRA